MKITAKVGGGGRSLDRSGRTSSVWLNNSKTIEAKGGGAGGGNDGGTDDGGNGYSGGGDFYHQDQDNQLKYNNGGSNGGKGGGPRGGSGSGDNIAAYSFDNFRLSPGQGGQFAHRVLNDDTMLNYGGGGGGVMVDNNGPSATPHQGKGYGGGGGPYSGDGLPGIILMEVLES